MNIHNLRAYEAWGQHTALLFLTFILLIAPVAFGQRVQQSKHTSFTIANQYLTVSDMGGEDENWLTYLLVNETSNTLAMPTGNGDSTSWFFLQWSKISSDPKKPRIMKTELLTSTVAKGPAGDVQYPWYVAPGDSAIFTIDLRSKLGKPDSTLASGYGIQTGQYMLRVDCPQLGYEYLFFISVAKDGVSQSDTCAMQLFQKGGGWFEEAGGSVISIQSTLLRLYCLHDDREGQILAWRLVDQLLSCPLLSLGAARTALTYYSDLKEDEAFVVDMQKWYQQLLDEQTEARNSIPPGIFRLIWKDVARSRGRLAQMPPQ